VYHYSKKNKRARAQTSCPHTPHSTLKLHLHPFFKLKEPLLSWECAIKKEIPFALTNSHILLSSSTCAKQAAELGAMPSNTHRFLCFQSVQAPRMIRELRSFRERAIGSMVSHGVAWLPA
jgi:hypothetical protein